LKATSQGLRAASVVLQSQPTPDAAAFAPWHRGRDLPSNLSRGATPPAEKLQLSRTPLHPARLTAGANPSDVEKLTDDDETTAWSNDGQRSTGWVRVEFDQPTQVSELVMRLGSWRTRSYPLRVTADDGHVVFTGVAARTVGYSTLRFPPVSCRALRIELAGDQLQTDAPDLVEVTGKTDRNGATGGGRGTLSIHELEIYGPAR